MPSARARTIGRLAALIAAGGFAFSATASAADELVLNRSTGRVSHDGVDFFVRGAEPGEELYFTLTDDDDPQSASVAKPINDLPVVADRSGAALFHVPEAIASAADRPFYLRAFTTRRTSGAARVVTSKFVLLRDVPALYLLIEGDRSTCRLVHFDLARGALEETRRGPFDGDAVLAVAGSTPIIEQERALVPANGGAAIGSGTGEEPIGLAVTPDQSALVELTREMVAGGRALLRLRVFDAGDRHRELGSLEVLRANSRLVSAWLVTGDDSHRILVADHDGVIREVVLGAELGRGLTLLPLSPLAPEELLDVRVVDDQLIALTAPAASKSRTGGESRLVVVDLRSREPMVDVTLSGRARKHGFEVVERFGHLTAFVVLDGGRVEVVPLGGEAPRALIAAPDALELALARDPAELYLLTSDARLDRASVARIDVDSLAVVPLDLPSSSHWVRELGVVEGVVEGSARRWLYWIEQDSRPGLRGEALLNDRLWCCELDRSTSLPIAGMASSQPLGGVVRRIAAN